MHFEILTEELSAIEALEIIIPKIVPDITFAFHAYQGKYDLLKKLPTQLKGYAALKKRDWRYVVLIDRDKDDCHTLKKRLDNIAISNSMIPACREKKNYFNLLNRIAIEELEAWFFGDMKALCKAFTKIDYKKITSKKEYRNPDDISGGTWEALFRELKAAGYYRRSMPKMRTARTIAKYMNPETNRSLSFRMFRDGLRKLRDTNI